MYHRVYAEAAEQSQIAGRRRERELLETAVRKLVLAKSHGVGSPEAFEATDFLRKLWTVFVLDLSNEENALPSSLKGSLISIGVWIGKEVDLIDAGGSENFDALIEVNQMIADGLI